MTFGRLCVGVIFGGRSGEHSISIRSSRFVVESLDRDRFTPVLVGIDRGGGWHLLNETEYGGLRAEVGRDLGIVVVPIARQGRCGLLDPRQPGRDLPALDVVFPVLHGPYGEDGTIQGLLDLLDVPYVGVGVLGAALCMDKDVCKRLLRDAGIPVVPFVAATMRDWAIDAKGVCERARALGSPLFVKPANLGSSLGVTRVSEPASAALASAIERALALDAKVLIERGIVGREIECAVLGNDEPEASLPGEILPGEAFYSYDDKYAADSRAQLRVPAALDAATRERVRALAVHAFHVLECRGMARVDFFLEAATGQLYVNELNSIPGFTAISMYPKMWAATGLSGAALITRLIELAQQRSTERRRLPAAG